MDGLYSKIVKAGGPSVDIPEAYRASADTTHYVVQFNGPLSQATRSALEKARAQIETRAPDALFRIASMTKPVVAVAILMLMEEGRVRLHDPV